MAWYNQIPVFGGLFDSPEQEALSQQFQNMAKAYGDYRYLHGDTRQTQLGQELGALGPWQSYLQSMFPGAQQFDMQGPQAQFANTVAAMKQNQMGMGVTGGQGPAAVAAPAANVQDSRTHAAGPTNVTDGRTGVSAPGYRDIYGRG